MAGESEILTEGRVIGRYVLYDALAAGGMATVHIGRILGEAGFSRSVAIKRLHPQFAHDPEFVSMFLEEARLAARIRHPNVVPVVDVVSMDSELFLVMDYIQGETLAHLTRITRERNRIVPLQIALAIASDMLAGLHAAHEARDENGTALGIVHRDVSPHNVMIGHDGVARVLDFGIAKASSTIEATREGSVKGKFSYMAPEQFRSKPVDRRTDVFAASIVLWEMLTGERLFVAEEQASIMAKVLMDNIKPPGMVTGGLPPAVDALVLRGLERDVNKRFPSALAMAQEIENLRLNIARPTEVGTWVDRIAGDTLKRRAKRLAQIESTGSFSRDQALAVAAAISGPLYGPGDSTSSQSGLRPRNAPPPDPNDVVIDVEVDGPVADLAPVDEPAPPKRRSRVGLVVALFLVAAVGAGAFIFRSKITTYYASLTVPPEPVGFSAHAMPTQPTQSAVVIAPPPPTTAAPSATPTGATLDLSVAPSASHKTNMGGNTGNVVHGTGRAPVVTPVVTATPTPPSLPTTPTGPLPQRPSLAAVQKALKANMPAARACVSSDSTPHANVTFQSDGTIKSVSVTGASGSEATCVKSAFMGARVDPFTDPTFSLPVTIGN